MRRTTSPSPHGARRRARDDGYVLALVALIVVPMLAITGFAVDLGAWYARASKVQQAADAAALAGVQDLPNLPTATATAKAVAAQNGFTDGANGITVTVSQVPDPTAKLKVTISDSSVQQFFTKPFRSNVSIERTGTAQYLKPISMGSPKNFLGTGNLAIQSNGFKENFWLAVSGGCASKENGDRIQALTDANFTNTANPATGSNGWAGCAGGFTIANTEYDANGYFYAIDFPQNYAGSVPVDIYDPGLCGAGVTGDSSGGTTFSTTFQMRDNTSFDPLSTGTLGPAKVYTSGNSGTSCGWQNLYTINNPTKGTYFVQVKSSNGNGTAQNGSNAFGLRAGLGSFSPCTSVATESVAGVPTYNPSCPNVHGYGNLGVYAPGAGNQADFYLAQIGPDYNNKKMDIALFDPGEGSRAMQILDPNGNPVDFTWEVRCYNGNSSPCSDGTVAPYGGWSGSSGTVSVPVTGNVAKALDLWGFDPNGTSVNAQPGPRRSSTSKYSDRVLVLTVQLPADINSAYGGRQWYRIKYYAGQGTVTDRTTWSVTISGAPVKLIPNP
jgi:Flp pilus assembly protein TadG